MDLGDKLDLQSEYLKSAALEEEAEKIEIEEDQTSLVPWPATMKTDLRDQELAPQLRSKIETVGEYTDKLPSTQESPCGGPKGSAVTRTRGLDYCKIQVQRREK